MRESAVVYYFFLFHLYLVESSFSSVFNLLSKVCNRLDIVQRHFQVSLKTLEANIAEKQQAQDLQLINIEIVF